MGRDSEVQYYGLNGSQSVALFQATLSFHKEVIQIPFSFIFKKQLDYDLLKKAFNLEIARFDCLRSRYVRRKRKNMQYFIPPYEEKNFQIYDFSSLSEEEENARLKKLVSKPLKFKKGEVYRIAFFKNHGGNTGILFIVSHMNMDAGGIFSFFSDLVDVYIALENGTELPAPPASFEESIKKELVKFNDPERRKKAADFLRDYLARAGEPFFASFSGTGPLERYRRKKRKPNLKYTGLLLFNNKTHTTQYSMGREESEVITEFCEKYSCNMAVFYKMAVWACLSKLNSNTERMSWLYICNGRATVLDKTCSGTKAQSIIESPTISYNDKVTDVIKYMMEMQAVLYANFGNEDAENEATMKSVFGSSPLAMYHAFIISYIPVLYHPKEGWDCRARWIPVGSFALPAYIAISHSMEDEGYEFCYDFQKALADIPDVDRFYANTVKALHAMIEYPDATMGEIIEKYID